MRGDLAHIPPHRQIEDLRETKTVPGEPPLVHTFGAVKVCVKTFYARARQADGRRPLRDFTLGKGTECVQDRGVEEHSIGR